MQHDSIEFGLIGEKLGHSYSKIIHEKLADYIQRASHNAEPFGLSRNFRCATRYTYRLIPLTLPQFHQFMREKNFKGINVTIPYKKEVLPYLDQIDEHARQIGAVNTIVNRDGKLTGYNTDCPGFLYMVQEAGVEVAGKKCLVLGTGGASQAIVTALSLLEAGPILRVSRSGRDGAVTYEECQDCHADVQIIVNTTPVGMYPNCQESPLDLQPFTQCEAVLDVIYNPLETVLTAQARQLGKIAATGLTMLVAQAKYACELFLGQAIDDGQIAVITDELRKEFS